MNDHEQGQDQDSEGAPAASEPGGALRRAALGAGLVGLVLALFGRAAGFDFVLWDDDLYVTRNPVVLEGLTWEGARWALGHEVASNWHPLTVLSHMLDVELFGTWAGGHHLTSVVLHAAATLVLFLVLASLTGRDLPSALAAALFGVHPLHVESVAWVAERKDVLSALLGFLAMGAWLAWTRRGGAGRYALGLALFALALTAKPMLVTLPCVLLLLCAWPTGRARRVGWGRCTLELVPWLALSAASSVATLLVQRGAGAMDSSGIVPFHLRIANALVAVARYLAKTVWPDELAVLYPHPYLVGGTPLGAVCVGLAALVVALVTLAVLRARRGYLTVGWLWFLGTLVPVLGLVQVGSQALADRYTYVPLVGLFVAAAFGLAELVDRGRAKPGVAVAAGLAAVLACCARSWVQLDAWRYSETLFESALAVSPGSPILLHNLGNVLHEEGRYEEAERRFREGLEVAPGFPDLRLGLGVTLRERGDAEGALAELRAGLARRPEHEALLYELALTLQGAERGAEAREVYERLLALRPDHVRARYHVALIALDSGDAARAVDELRAVVRLDPGWIEARNNLAWLLASSADDAVRSPDEAVALAEETLARAGTPSAALLDTLGVAYASAGRFADALRACDRGIELATQAGEDDLARALRVRRALYEAERPFRSARR